MRRALAAGLAAGLAVALAAGLGGVLAATAPAAAGDPYAISAFVDARVLSAPDLGSTLAEPLGWGELTADRRVEVPAGPGRRPSGEAGFDAPPVDLRGFALTRWVAPPPGLVDALVARCAADAARVAAQPATVLAPDTWWCSPEATADAFPADLVLARLEVAAPVASWPAGYAYEAGVAWRDGDREPFAGTPERPNDSLVGATDAVRLRVDAAQRGRLGGERAAGAVAGIEPAPVPALAHVDEQAITFVLPASVLERAEGIDAFTAGYEGDDARTAAVGAQDHARDGEPASAPLLPFAPAELPELALRPGGAAYADARATATTAAPADAGAGDGAGSGAGVGADDDDATAWWIAVLVAALVLAVVVGLGMRALRAARASGRQAGDGPPRSPGVTSPDS